MENAKTINVSAAWDPVAEVWVAQSDEVPGLITEAPSENALRLKLQDLIPELLEANHCAPDRDAILYVAIQYRREDKMRLHHAA